MNSQHPGDGLQLRGHPFQIEHPLGVIGSSRRACTGHNELSRNGRLHFLVAVERNEDLVVFPGPQRVGILRQAEQRVVHLEEELGGSPEDVSEHDVRLRAGLDDDRALRFGGEAGAEQGEVELSPQRRREGQRRALFADFGRFERDVDVDLCARARHRDRFLDREFRIVNLQSKKFYK